MTRSTNNPQAPPGYQYHAYLFEDWEARKKYPFWMLLLGANFVALIPLAGGVLILWLPYQFYRMVGTPYALLPELQLPLPLLIGLGILVIGGSMLLHEWLHGIALTFLGYTPRYAFNKYYLLATVADGTFLTRSHYLQMALTPITLMTIIGATLLPFLPPVVGQILLIALLLNLAASLGDIMVAIRVYKTPKEALFADNKGIHVFLPLLHSSSPTL